MIIALSGSSCCGKNTIIKELLSLNENLEYIHSFTSREMRAGESEGNPYYYLSKSEFQQKIKNGDFFEHELIHNNFYGVEKNICKQLLETGEHLIKDMGVIGTFNLKEQLNESFVETIYLYVSKRELKKRLKNRGDDKKQIKLRLKRFKFEKANMKKYNFVIHNNNKENTIKIMQKLIENNDFYYNFINLAKDLSKVDEKKLQIYQDDLINNKEFKPIKVYFNGKDFFVKKDLEKYLASIITGKNIAKKIVLTNKKFNKVVLPEEISNFCEDFEI